MYTFPNQRSTSPSWAFLNREEPMPKKIRIEQTNFFCERPTLSPIKRKLGDSAATNFQPKKLTPVRKEVIMEYLAKRPHPYKDDLTGFDSLTEIIRRMKRRNSSTGNCTHEDVRAWLARPYFTEALLSASAGNGETMRPEIPQPVFSPVAPRLSPTIPPAVSEEKRGGVPRSLPDMTEFVTKIVLETIEALKQVPEQNHHQPSQKSHLSKEDVKYLWSEKLQPDSDAHVLMEGLGGLIHVPPCTVPVTLFIQPTSWIVGKYHPSPGEDATLDSFLRDQAEQNEDSVVVPIRPGVSQDSESASGGAE